MAFFPEYGSDYKFAELEQKVLHFWDQNKIFARTLDQKKYTKDFLFYDGPPFATGLPHYGHLIGGTIKDIVPRYWTMRGYHVARRFGWDCHGLPVEFEMEKTLNLSGSLAILDYGVDKFNEACRGIVLRYVDEWKKTVKRSGRWVDMENDYKTMNPEFMESVWWVFKELWDKGLVYQGKKVVPYSWRLTAPLSNFEASLNYKDIQDPAITVLFPITTFANTALAVWTTTPWTLPSNLAVAINPDPEKVRYGRYKLTDPVGTTTHVIVADDLAEKFGLNEKTDPVANRDLEGTFYTPLFSLYDDEIRKQERAFRVITSDHVSNTDGTGLVHMAPAFGEDDFYACQRVGITLVDPTDMQASFMEIVKKDPLLADVVGLFVKDGDKHIIKQIKNLGRLMKQDTLQHSYPFCERSDTPLIYKAISSWFVQVEAIKDKMLAANAQIKWVPSHLRDGRFGKWLENARDWCISRNRFWGTPIPVWACKKCAHLEVIGSREALNTLAKKEMPDLHKHFVDLVVADCPGCGAKDSLVRTPEVLDCWFESGSMPFAQEHYPFENKARFDKQFPADFIAEGIDQTRGWFYTLTVLSAALKDKPAFKNVIVNGTVLAEDGTKMSKRLRNYPDPNILIEKYGADALRLYLMQSPAMHAEDLRFSEKGLVELMRAVLLPLWNSYGFFASYANIDGWDATMLATAPAVQQRTQLDQWILLRARQMEISVHESMGAYKLNEVAPKMIDFIDDLTNWYIRLNRSRFWAEGNVNQNADKAAAFASLWTAIDTLARIMAPSLPFYAEVLHASLRGVAVDQLSAVANNSAPSVHETIFSDPATLTLSKADNALLTEIDLAKKLMLLGRALRGEAKIGLRQPLPSMRVAGLSNEQIIALKRVEDLVCREVNIKRVELVEKASDLVEESIKPNFKVLGKKAGKHMKDIQAALLKWGRTEISAFDYTGRAQVCGVWLTREDIEVVRKAKPGKLAQAGYGIVAELDITLSPALIEEGICREIINRIQQKRKEMKLHLSDRIVVKFSATGLVEKILANSEQSALIAAETLAQAFVPSTTTAEIENFETHGHLAFEIQKA